MNPNNIVFHFGINDFLVTDEKNLSVFVKNKNEMKDVFCFCHPFDINFILSDTDLQYSWIRINTLQGYQPFFCGLEHGTESVKITVLTKNYEQAQQVAMDFSDFIGLTVHRYNNFLTAINGNAEIAKFNIEANAPIHEELEQILLSVQQTIAFNHELLFAAGRGPIEAKAFDKAAVISMLQALEIDRLHDSSITYQFEFNMTLLTNWLQNCIEFLQGMANKQYPENQSEIECSLINFPSVNQACTHQNKLLITLFCASAKLELQEQKNIFLPFYSSKHLLGNKDLGLIKIKEGLKQRQGDCQVLSCNEGTLICLSLAVEAETSKSSLDFAELDHYKLLSVTELQSHFESLGISTAPVIQNDIQNEEQTRLKIHPLLTDKLAYLSIYPDDPYLPICQAAGLTTILLSYFSSFVDKQTMLEKGWQKVISLNE